MKETQILTRFRIQFCQVDTQSLWIKRSNIVFSLFIALHIDDVR